MDGYRNGLTDLCDKEPIFSAHSEIQSPNLMNLGSALGICHPTNSKNTHTPKEQLIWG